MKELANIYKEAGQRFVDDLFKDYLLVTEKLSGSSFSFERHGDELKFFKGSNKMPINLVDRTLMMYYESAIQYILDKTEGHIKDLPEYWRFCFQYFVNNQPGAIKYDNLPTNNLVLTHIQVRNPKGKIAKVIEDPRVLRDWASAFNVTPLIPIFSGYLKEDQKRKIREFLSTPKEDQLEVFGTSSFAKYLIDSLNPTIKQTTLQSDLTKPIDSIIFKFFKQGTKQIFTAKMIDPYTETLMKNKEPIDLRRAPADINEILLLDILAFIEERGLRGGELLTANPHERYLELVSNLFNDYVAKRGVDLKKLDIEKAEFAKGPEFDLNLDLIKNTRTREILQKSESLQNLYKIILGSLRKKRNSKRVGAVMTASVIEDFNKLVTKISDTINKETDGKFKTFGDYLNNKVTEEIDHKDLEELIVEEKALNYNKFIDLAKVNINENKNKEVEHVKYYNKFVEDSINEKQLSVSIDGSRIGSINDNDIDAINTIKRIAGSSVGKEEVLATLTNIGIPEDYQNDIINILAGGDWAKASAYLLNRTLDVNKLLGKKLPSAAINKKYFGLADIKLSDKLFKFQWPTQPPMGKGEAWLAMIIDKGSKAGVGDVEINGNNTEVKGVGARLVGQKGYGDAKKMPIRFKDALISICNDLGIDYEIKDGNGLAWSVTKKEPRLLGENLKAMSEIKGGFSSKDLALISKSIIESYQELYTGLNASKYQKILIPVISKDGTIDSGKYCKALLKLSYEYYLQVEQFVYFAMTNSNTGNFLIIKPDGFNKLVDDGTVKYSPQSWGSSSGTQGGYFAIALDKLSK